MEKRGFGCIEFTLTKEIPIKSFPNLLNLEFKTRKNKKNEVCITKLIFSFKRKTLKGAEREFRIKAENIANLLSVDSNIHTAAFQSNSFIQEYDTKKEYATVSFLLSGEVYRPSKIPKKELKKVLTDQIYSQQIARLANALKCSKNLDWNGTIIELNLAMKEDYRKYPDLKKFKYLRDVLGHDELDNDRAKKYVVKLFPKNYFDFTLKNQFDLLSQKNKDNLRLEAGKFLSEVMKIFEK